MPIGATVAKSRTHGCPLRTRSIPPRQNPDPTRIPLELPANVGLDSASYSATADKREMYRPARDHEVQFHQSLVWYAIDQSKNPEKSL